MKKEFEKIIAKYASDKKTLLAVSGGVDSMVLLTLFIESDSPIEVAHCNFMLRSEESDQDEHLVREYCKKRNITFHSRKFETEKYAAEYGLGIQEAARDLRYAWFEQLLDENDLDLVCTAHHQDDQSETIIMNFIRGAGPAGLSGMQALRGNLFRPLLTFSKAEILEFADSESVPYREDSSNLSTKYRRNEIRLDLVPRLKEMNPGLDDTLSGQANLMQEVRNLMRDQLPALAVSILDDGRISVEKLVQSDFPILLLGEIFRDYDLSREQRNEIFQLTTAQTGAEFIGSGIHLLRDREFIINIPESESEPTQVFNDPADFANSEFEAEYTNATAAKFSGPHEAWLDADVVKFPLTLRPWQEGDRFQPLGMEGSQKVSDLIIQRKISKSEKSKIMVLCSDDTIIWIPKIHTDDRFKLTAKSVKALHLRCK